VYCVFCRADDLPALWAYRGLKRRGLDPLEIFTPEALVYNRRLEHRLQASETITRIELADGRVLESAKLRGVLNRLSYLPVDHFRAALADDRPYAGLEQQAIFLSWMHALPGVVINRPWPRSLCGEFRSPAEWVWLAVKAGLPVLPYHQSDGQALDYPLKNATYRMVAFDGQIYNVFYPWVDESLRNSIHLLAGLSGLRLMGLDFLLNPAGEPQFVNATSLPDLQLGGDVLLDVLKAGLV
jgi:hypothetical protein